ncbi:MAG: zinc ribbon domain-containing protein [Anaeroplasmataceae bacterium]|nr:zinc ribbon domain-containing protein [Anaeroplasmataceae bacterium]
MFCKKCGSNIPDDENICPYCGEPVDGRYKKPEKKQEVQDKVQNPVVKLEEKKEKESKDFSFSNVKAEEPVDHGSIGYIIIGLLAPTIGLILFLVWKNEKPKSAKQCGIGALINVILTGLFIGISIVCMIAMGEGSISIRIGI